MPAFVERALLTSNIRQFMNEAPITIHTTQTIVNTHTQAPRWTHNHAHRKKWTAEFRAWHSMRNRCYNTKDTSYGNYGQRGITVCKRWNKSFKLFLQALGPKPSRWHSLDRINNRRTNRHLVFAGERLTIAEWARRINVNYATVHSRLRSRWSISDCLSVATRPIQKYTAEGQTLNLSEWSRISGVSRALIAHRIKVGWTVEDAIFLPAIPGRRRPLSAQSANNL